MITETMFAIPIGITQISQSTCDKIKPLKGSTQNEATRDLFDVLKDYPEIKKVLTFTFTVWINELLKTPDSKWVMTTNWITENPTGYAMKPHSHKNCAYSGVLYFDKVDDSHEALWFDNPLTYFSSFLAESSSKNKFNIASYFVEPAEGRMIFFPSYLMHYHHAAKPTSIPRRSLACNFFPVGKYGGYDSYIDTNWLRHG